MTPAAGKRNQHQERGLSNFGHIIYIYL